MVYVADTHSVSCRYTWCMVYVADRLGVYYVSKILMLHAAACSSICVYLYICMYVCIYIYIYAYMHAYIHVFPPYFGTSGRNNASHSSVLYHSRMQNLC